MTRTEYETAVARFREVPGGTVEVTDFFPRESYRRPYRGAWLKVRVTKQSARDRIADLTSLAFEISSYLTMVVYNRDEGEITLQASRDLDEDEIGDDPPVATRAVTG